MAVWVCSLAYRCTTIGVLGMDHFELTTYQICRDHHADHFALTIHVP